MLHRKNSSYLEDKLVKNSKNPVELQKILKPLCLHANKKKIAIISNKFTSDTTKDYYTYISRCFA